MKTVYFIFLLIFFSVICAQAQKLTEPIKIGEVRILGEKKVEEAGLQISKPDSLVQKSWTTASLSELIASWSPVFVKSYGSGSTATASFRGTSATHTAVVWNGMNLNSPLRGVADLSLLPVFFADEVYLLHGGSSLSQGSGALGGSIHLDNQPRWNQGFRSSGIFETGSFQSKKVFLRLNTGKNRFSADTRLYFESSGNNFPYYNAGILPHRKDTLENADYKKYGLLQELYFRSYSDNIFSLRFWIQQSQRNLPQLMSYQGSPRDEKQDDRQIRMQFDWKKYDDNLNYHFFSGINMTRLDYFRATPAFGFVNEDTQSRESGFVNHLRIFRSFSEKLYATASLDVNLYDVEVSNQITGKGFHKQRLETSILLNWHMKPSDRLAAFMLIRSENYDARVVPFIPSAGVEWQVSPYLPVLYRVNAARNYHKPTMNDLYWLPGGNPDLLAEDGYTGDMSLSASAGKNRLKTKTGITGFLSVIENWIIWQPSSTGAYYWEAANVKNVLSRGMESWYSLEYHSGNTVFRSGGNYAYTRTTDQHAQGSADRSRGKQLLYIPVHKANIYLAASSGKTSVKYDLDVVGKRYTTSGDEQQAAEYVLMPYALSRISVEQSFLFANMETRLKCTVNNLFNQDYQAVLWRPAPGRNYSLTLSLSYPENDRETDEH